MGVAVGCGEGGKTAGREVAEGLAAVGDKPAVGSEVGDKDVGEETAGVEAGGAGVAVGGAATTPTTVACLGKNTESARAGQVG